MNRIFKVVWSKSRQAYIVVSEYAKSRGGKTKIVAAVLAVIMGTAVQAPVWAANDRATLDPATQKIVDEVMKQVEANYVKKGTGNGTAVDNDMVKPGENPVKANAEQYGAVAIGRNAHAVQYRTVAIGAGAYANIDGGIAILGNTLQNDGISFGRDSYARGIAGIAIGRDTQSGVNSITIGRMARAAYSRPGNIGNPGAKVTHPLGGDDTNNPVFNKNAVAIGTNSLAGASNIVFLTPGTENTYLDFASTANIWASRVYSRAQMTKIKDGTKKHISDRFYGEGDINTAASDDKKVNFYDVVRDSGTDQVAVGHHSRALGDQAIAIGSNSIAGRYSIVMGGNTFGDGKQNDSFYAMYLNNDGIFRKLSGYRKVDNNPGNPNEGSTYAGEAGVAIGTKAHVLTQMGTAVGALARIEQDSFGAVALGAGASVGTQKAGHDSIGAVAIGMGSAAKGNGTVVLGARASAWPDSGDAHRITAVGYGTIAKNADSVALGSLAEADRGSDMAGYFYGYKAATIDQSKEAGSIQLKLKDGAADLIENYEVKVTPSAWEVPKATETDIENGIRTHVYAGLKGPAFKANAGALSIGKNGSTPDATDAITRQIVNVAAGTNDTDAVNVAQLRNVNMMVEADSAGAGTPKAFSDFLLDNARLKISGQSYLSTELTQDKEGPRITLKAKTTELIANPDGSFSTKNHEDGLITAGELVKRMNAAKQARDELEKKIGELVYLNAKGEKLQQKGGKFFKVNPDGSLDESKEETPAAITSKRQGLQLANVNGAVTQLTPDGLADLSNISEKTGVNVNDISKIGWILSVPDDKYSEAVVHNRKVSFFGKDLAKVTAAGKGEEPRMITVTVDRKETGKAVEQEFLNNGFTQIRYVDANNKPLVRAQDGKYYYPVSDKDNTPDTSKPSVAPAARVADVESHPTVLTNVKHGADVINKTGDPTDGLADLSKDSQKSNVATVEDLRNLGFVIKGKADDDSAVTGQVKHANTVEFAGEDLAHVVVTSKDGKHKVTVKVNKDDVTQAVNAANAQKGTAPTAYVDKDGNPLVKGDDGNYHKVKDDGTLDNDTTDPAGVRLGEKDTPMQLTNVKPGTNEITAEGPTKGLADLEHAVPGTVATVDDLKKMGFVVADGAKYHATVANAQTVKFVGEGLATVTGETKDDVRTFTVKVDKDEVAKAINAEGAKKGTAPTTYVDKDGNPLVKGSDGKYYKPKADGTPDTDGGAVDPAGVRLGEKDKPIQLTNVAPATEAINKANDPTNGLADLAKAKDGTVATVADLKKLGFVVSAGDSYSEKVQHAQEVNFKGEGLAEVSGKTEGEKRIITVKVDDKKVADAVKSINDKAGNAPTQYVDKDGNSLVKAKDGKYYPKDKVGDDGQPTQDAQAVEPSGIQVGEKGKPTQLTNVKPGTNEITAEGPTKGLADLEHAVPGTVATVDDLKRVGFVVADGGNYHATVTNAQTVKFVGEGLAEVSGKTEGEKRIITVKVDKEEVAKAINADSAKKGSAPTTYVDKDGNPLVKGSDGKYYKPKADGTPDTDGGAVDPAGVRLGEKDKPIQLTNVAPATEAINKANDPTNGLADLAKAKDGTVATVADLKKLGFVVSAGDSYSEKVQHAQEVNFKGEGLAEVSGKTEGEKRIITVTVDDKKVADAVKSINDKAGNAPTQYVDKDGNPLVKAKDGKYYPKDKVGDDGQPTQDAQAVEPSGIQVGEKGKPTQLTNVKPGTNEITAEGPTKGLADLEHAVPGTVATVDDLKKLGFIIKGTDTAGKPVNGQVKHTNTVEFAGEDLAKVITESKDGASKVTVKVNKEDIVKVVNDANDKKGSAPTQYVDKDGNPLVKDGDKYYKQNPDGTPNKGEGEKTPAGIQVGEKGKTTQLTNVAPATSAIDKENDPTNGLADLANAKSGTVATVDDLKRVGFVVADGGNYHATVTNAQTVKFVGEGLAEVSGKTENDVRTFTVKVDDKKVADAVKSINDKAGNAPTQYVDKDGNSLVKAKDGKYYPKDKVGDDGQPTQDAQAVEPSGIQVGEKGKPTQLTNVKPGTNEITAEGPTKGLADLEHAVPGTVATVDDLKRVGFVVADGGNYHATVTNAQTVKFVGEGLAEVSGKTENDVRTFTVKVDDKKVADAVKSINDKAGNAPTQYVDKDGNPLVKAKDGNYYPKDKVGDDGQPIQGAQAVEPAGIQVGEKGKPTQLTNVAPATEAINKANDPTNGLADLANAKDGTVATVADLKKLGFVIKGKAEDGTTDVVAQVKHADTVEFAGEDLAKVITESANGVSKVTVKVNKEEIAKAVNAENAKKGSEPTTYVDENGDPLVKGDDGKYYKPKADGTPDTDAGEKTPAGIRLGEKDKPIQLDNVARGTESKPVNKEDGQPMMGTDTKPVQLADLKAAKDTKVATVGDLKDMGFVLGASVNADGGNKAYQDVVKNGNKVKFVGLGGAWISGKTAADGTRIITIDVNADNLVTGTQNAIQYVDGKGNRMIPMLQKGNEVLYYNAADNPVKHKMPNSDEEAVYRMSDIVEGTGTLKPDAQPLQGKKAADVPNLGVALVHPNGSADTTEGTVLRNVGVGTATIAAPTDDKDIVGKAKAGLADLANSKDTNGLSVADAKKLGFVIKGKAADGTTDVTGQVKHANTVEFAGEDLAKVITESANGVSKVTVKVNKEDIVKVVNDANDKKGSAPTQYVDKDGNPLVKAKDGKYYPKDKVGDDGTPQTGAQAVDPVGIQVGEKDKPTQLMNIAPGTTSIATPTDPNASQADKAKAGLADLSIPTDAASDNVSKHTAATVDDLRRMGWILSVGDTYADKVQNAQEVNFKGAGLAEVSGQTEGQKRVITVTVDEQKVAAAVKAINDKAGNAPIHYVDQEGNPLVKAKDNKYYPTDKVDNEGNVIAGAKDAVPVVQIGEKGHPMQLTNVAAGTSEIKEGPTKGLADLEHAASGTVATVDDLQKLGFVIKGTDENGKAVSGQVRHANTVEFAGDGLAKVITESKDGVSKVTVKVNKEEIAKAVNAENAKNGSAPTQYVDKDGNSLVKDGDKYYKAKDDGTPDTTAGPVDPAGVQIGEKNKPITVTNVKSNFAEVAPDAKEVKAPESKKNPDGSVDPTAANPLVAMQHNAATIADIMNSPWNLQVNGKAVKAVKSFDTVNITDGTNTKVVATETGYKVNVVGLPTAYTDNAGNTIAKGTDGKWFVTDKDGNMTATPADLGQDGKGTPSVSLVNPAAEPGKAGEPVVMHNVGQGNLPTDAVNKDQMDTAIAGMAKAIGNTKDEAHGIGADAAALAALKPLQYDPVEPTQIMAGIGNYQQKTAVALGVAHYTNESTMLNAGVSLGTGHTMVNVGYTRKFGHTKDEKEIPDRYKAGPISSIYVMQDEVSALKAENEQQKREIQELREMVLAMAANKK
ncbi:ESPR-type extended signal peptide-containing protein [uncultured Megasphaera sp.]|uniref:ESPR-type extended signal peptide-containing protein n=2 Tax=uncultured Megasphaera sp. TaxID=165188 RepID=UPI0025950775|nr:ESPR-type extended signal peptide-containing protein [uncultured Megasphaera sp.]